MPKKVRQLKQMLKKAGFSVRPGKGSHTVWGHPNLGGETVTVSGNDGDDAKPYQEKQVREAIKKAEEDE
jgi:predicted RNA binding protein YcfA (HicA-like mRNA interferase family)